MNDIPLKSIRRTQRDRAGYSQLQTDEHSNGHANGTAAADMPASVRPAASAFLSRKARGKRRADSVHGGYSDEVDEEQTLLADHEHEEDEGPSGRVANARGISIVSRLYLQSYALQRPNVLL